MDKFFTEGQKKQLASRELNNKISVTRKETNDLHEKAIDAVVSDSCAFNVFTKPGMRSFIQYLKPGYQPPNRKTIATRLKKK
jgi:hypothetical protein